MTSSFSNYLRTHRRRCGFTQQELAFLLGCKTGQIISRYEHNIRTPNLKTIFALQIVFGLSIDEIFPEKCSHTKNLVRGRVHKLMANLLKQTKTLRRQRKLEMLAGIENYASNTTTI